jgi:hypothetical protein
MRLQISSASGGSPINYTVPINPTFYDAKDEPNTREIEVLHGARIWQKPLYDNRVRIFKWENLDVSNIRFFNMFTYLRSIEGQVRYFNFRILDDINPRWPSALTWKKVRIINAVFAYNKGGTLRTSLELHFKPEN